MASRATHHHANRIPPSVHFLRAGLRTINLIAPPLAGKLATNLFLRTRSGRPRSNPPPLGATTLDINVPGLGDIHVWGKEGPWALLVHGWGADSRTMFAMANRLQQEGYRAVTFDAPCHGSAPGGTRTTMTDFTAAVRELLQQLKEVKLVVGHSLGGIAAVSAMEGSITPERLILVSTPCDLPLVLERWASFFHLPPALIQRMRQQLLLRNGVPVDYWNLRERGKQLACPTLVFHGDQDVLVPPIEATHVVNALPKASARIEAGLGHHRILMNRHVLDATATFADLQPYDTPAAFVAQ